MPQLSPGTFLRLTRGRGTETPARRQPAIEPPHPPSAEVRDDLTPARSYRAQVVDDVFVRVTVRDAAGNFQASLRLPASRYDARILWRELETTLDVLGFPVTPRLRRVK